MCMSFHRWCLFLTALVYFTAAWFGVGYYSEDEQRHVIEFAEALRGKIPEEALAVEYHTRIRSMVQPVLCAGVFAACEAVGISDPFDETLVLRLITVVLALWVIHGFVRAVIATISDELKSPFILLSYFLWFVPVLNIRFSGEAWSGLLFLRGLSVMMNDRRARSLMVTGLWFGAAVFFRPAVAMLPFGVVLWLVFKQRTEWRGVFKLFVAGAVVLLLGVLIDSIAYGEPVFTLGNYARAGLLGEEAWRFTSLPWYQYILFIFKYVTPPIALVLFTAFVLLITFRHGHILVWIIAPFMIAHSMLPVKEIRFLFPLALLMPWLLIAAWEMVGARWPMITHQKTLTSAGLGSLALLNLVALLVAITTPAGNGRIELAQVVHQRFGTTPVDMTCVGDWHIWISLFYLSTGSTSRYAETPADPGDDHPPGDEPELLISQGEMKNHTGLMDLATSHPRWCLPLLRLHGLEDGFEPLVLYQRTAPDR